MKRKTDIKSLNDPAALRMCTLSRRTPARARLSNGLSWGFGDAAGRRLTRRARGARWAALRASLDTCPVRALRLWLDKAGITEGPGLPIGRYRAPLPPLRFDRQAPHPRSRQGGISGRGARRFSFVQLRHPGGDERRARLSNSAHAVHRRLGDAACAEGVPAELLDLQSRLPAARLRSLPIESECRAPRDVTISANRPEDRAFGNPGLVEPQTQRSDWASIQTRSKRQAHLAPRALLVSLRPAASRSPRTHRQSCPGWRAT